MTFTRSDLEQRSRVGQAWGFKDARRLVALTAVEWGQQQLQDLAKGEEDDS